MSSRLVLWFSPAFPTGAFAFSHGLEWAVEAGDVTNRATLLAWLDGLLRFGGPRADAVMIALAVKALRVKTPRSLRRPHHPAASTGAQPQPTPGSQAFDDLAELALALQPSAERRLETVVQGEAFLRALRAAWPKPALDRLAARHPRPALPIAVAMAVTSHREPLGAALEAFLTGAAANLVSAAVRLAPIGQTDGLHVLAALEPTIRATARMAAAAREDELGTCALRSDIASLAHETQSTRLFRS